MNGFVYFLNKPPCGRLYGPFGTGRGRRPRRQQRCGLPWRRWHCNPHLRSTHHQWRWLRFRRLRKYLPRYIFGIGLRGSKYRQSILGTIPIQKPYPNTNTNLGLRIHTTHPNSQLGRKIPTSFRNAVRFTRPSHDEQHSHQRNQICAHHRCSWEYRFYPWQQRQ